MEIRFGVFYFQFYILFVPVYIYSSFRYSLVHCVFAYHKIGSFRTMTHKKLIEV